MVDIKIKPFETVCELKQFEINGMRAYYKDFGDKYDYNPNIGEPYGCGDVRFTPKPPTTEILNKYNITVDEYNEICEKLNCLSFGNCGRCI